MNQTEKMYLQSEEALHIKSQKVANNETFWSIQSFHPVEHSPVVGK